MRAYQAKLEGGETVAGLTPIQRQLAEIMDAEPDTAGDEDLLAALWVLQHTANGRQLVLDYPAGALENGRHPIVRIVAGLYGSCRVVNVRERRRELTKKGYPWPPEEAARRQRQGRAGVPGGRCVK